jgi:hypothetical protein
MGFTHNRHILEHHSLMEFLKREIILYWLWHGPWWAMQTFRLLNRVPSKYVDKTLMRYWMVGDQTYHTYII